MGQNRPSVTTADRFHSRSERDTLSGNQRERIREARSSFAPLAISKLNFIDA
jgi:hypothetical protein